MSEMDRCDYIEYHIYIFLLFTYFLVTNFKFSHFNLIFM